jgi:hypothetical protein
MTYTTQSTRLAGTALAAVLAFASYPALAQDAVTPFPTVAPPEPAPVIVVPDIALPAPAPTVVLPAEVPEPAPVPEASAEPAPPAAAPAEPRAQSQAVNRVERTPATGEPAAVTQAGTVTESAPSAEVDPVALPPVVEPLPPLEAEPVAGPDARVDTGIIALAIGGLIFLALAIWGFIAIGRRKPVRRFAAAAPAAPQPRKPVVAQAAQASPVTVDAAPRRQVVQPVVPATAAAGLPHAGASVALPRRLPDSFEEREALFRRMVEARPDRANPFTDRKARMKRARLIMQSIRRDFGDVKPWIDLTQYPHNWPELARQRSAAA